MTSALWWTDWDIRDGAAVMRKTGVRLALKRSLIVHILNWLLYYACMEAWRIAAFARGGPRVAFLPDRPRPWYFIWPVLHAAGGRIVRSPDAADAVFFFEDVTRSVPPAAPVGVPIFNFACPDVSKSRVAAVFEQVFGYPVRVDPRRETGPIVEKSETNGRHDGCVVDAPYEPREGCVYQRIVDNACGDGLVEDLRCVAVAGRIACVFIKRRPLGRRFANINTAVEYIEPAAVFAPEEIRLIESFAAMMGLDWGAIDVLRDRQDGRLYIVDVNKTNIDPPAALPLQEKLRATRTMARIFRNVIDSVKTRPLAPARDTTG